MALDSTATVPSVVSVTSQKQVLGLRLAVAENEIFTAMINRARNVNGSVATDIVEPLLLDPPSAASLTDGTTYASATQITASSLTLTIAERGLRAEITDGTMEDTLTGGNGVLTQRTIETFGNSIAIATDALVLGMASSLTTNVINTSTTTLDTAAWQSMIEKLDTQVAHSYGENYMAVLYPSQYHSLAGDIDDAATYDAMARNIFENLGKAAQQNFKGNLYGVDTYMSTNVTTSGSGKNGVMFVPSAFFFAEKRPTRVEMARVDPGDRADTIVVSRRFVYGEDQDKLAGRILSI